MRARGGERALATGTNIAQISASIVKRNEKREYTQNRNQKKQITLTITIHTHTETNLVRNIPIGYGITYITPTITHGTHIFPFFSIARSLSLLLSSDRGLNECEVCIVTSLSSRWRYLLRWLSSYYSHAQMTTQLASKETFKKRNKNYATEIVAWLLSLSFLGFAVPHGGVHTSSIVILSSPAISSLPSVYHLALWSR